MLTISWSDCYHHPLPEGHRFPMEKYSLIPEQLLYEGTIREENLFDPGQLSEEEVLLTHDRGYWEQLKYQQLTPREQRRTGFPLSPQLIERALTIPKGTLQNALYAMEYGVSFNGAGGTHHAFADHGEGFCLLNDIAIASNLLLRDGTVRQILVVDLDVHQGNGTAHIFREEPRVFTFSMHCEANYPMRKEESDLDVALPPYIGDAEYLKELHSHLPRLIDRVQPDLIFYLAGVDILETDKLGKLNCSRAGCKARDVFVFETAKQNEIPVAVALGGGYSPQIKDIVEAHANTFRVAQEIWF